MDRAVDLRNQAKMGKLPTESFYRLALLAKKRAVESKIKATVTDNSFQALQGYHLHCSSSEPSDESIQENQVHIYVANNWIYAKYLGQGKPKKTSISTARLPDPSYTTIVRKLSKNIPLTSEEVSDVMQVFKDSYGLALPVLPQNKHPLLKTMDDYIISMQKKSDAGHVNIAMADDKIEFTKTLRTFVENPTETNWHQVRQAMHAYPRYGFSWTGMSQADYFLTVIKIQHKAIIDGYDSSYANKKTEAKTSWGRFVYNFGFAYYIPSVFMALYKLVQFIYHEGAREYYHYQMNDLRKNMNSSITSDSPFKKKADEIIDNLETYLSENDLDVNEEVVAYIDEIDERINELGEQAIGPANRTTTNAIEALADAIKQLIPRPVPLRDMSYIQLSQ